MKMMNSHVVMIIISVLSGIVTSIVSTMDIISIIKKKKEDYKSVKKCEIVLENFNTANHTIDKEISNYGIITYIIKNDDEKKETAKKYIEILLESIKQLYTDDMLSIRVLILDKGKEFLKTYITTENEDSNSNVELNNNGVFNNIISKKYSYAFVKDANLEKDIKLTTRTNDYIYTFISYPIINNNTSDIIGLINISSRCCFNDDNSNKIIVNLLSETSKDLSKLIINE